MALGGVALHGGNNVADAFATFEPWQLAASALLVGALGGALYWYYGQRVRGSAAAAGSSATDPEE